MGCCSVEDSVFHNAVITSSGKFTFVTDGHRRFGIPRRVMTQGIGVAKVAFKKPYTVVPIETMSKELGISRTTVKESVRSLAALNIIERVDTPGYTRTLILVKAADGKILRISPDCNASTEETEEEKLRAVA